MQKIFRVTGYFRYSSKNIYVCDEKYEMIFLFQVMETKNMLYIVSEFAPNGEIFGLYLLPSQNH